MGPLNSHHACENMFLSTLQNLKLFFKVWSKVFERCFQCEVKFKGTPGWDKVMCSVLSQIQKVLFVGTNVALNKVFHCKAVVKVCLLNWNADPKKSQNKLQNIRIFDWHLLPLKNSEGPVWGLFGRMLSYYQNMTNGLSVLSCVQALFKSSQFFTAAKLRLAGHHTVSHWTSVIKLNRKDFWLTNLAFGVTQNEQCKWLQDSALKRDNGKFRNTAISFKRKQNSQETFKQSLLSWLQCRQRSVSDSTAMATRQQRREDGFLFSAVVTEQPNAFL